MSASLQTFVALAIVVLTIAALLWSALKKKKRSACGCGDTCSAVTPEIKRLQTPRRPAG